VRSHNAETRDARRQRSYAALFALTEAAAVFVDPTGEAIVDLDDVWSSWTGEALDALRGGPWEALVDPDDRATLRAAARRLRDGAEARVTFETRARAVGNTQRVLSWSAALDSADGAVLAVARDVTGTRAHDLDRRRAEARADALLAALPDLVFVFDPDGRIVDYQAPHASMLAMPPEAFLGRTVFEVMPPALTTHLAPANTLLEARTFEYALTFGEPAAVHHFHANLAPLRDGAGAVAVVREITARVEVEAERQRSRQHLEEAQAMTHLGSWEFDPATGVIVWSDEMHRIFRIPREGVGPSFEEYSGRIHPDDREGTQRAIDRALRQGIPYDLWYRIVVSGGELRHLHCHGEATRDARGAIVGLRGTALDRTVERQTELDLVKAREAALVASRAKSQFLANMSHEIRTPLNGVLGMTALALETATDPEQRELIETAHASGKALMGVVNDILDLSKIEAGAIELESAAFSPVDVAGEAVLALAPRADEKGVELVVHVAPDAPASLMGDALRFRQVVMNLVSNAVKFTARGEVEVTLGRSADGGALRVSVRDSGIGIPHDRIEAIFEAFTQVDGSITRRFGGTGLGLSISRQLAMRMGGSLWGESVEGAGSTFTFELPIGAAPAAVEAPLSLPPSRLLVVDDHPAAARALAALLTSCGASVTLAASAVEAALAIDRARAAGAPFDAVLVDAADARSPAAALASLLAGKAAPPRVALVSVRGFGRDEAPAAVRKPLSPRDVVAAVCAVISRESTPRAAAAPSAAPGERRCHVLVAEDNEVNARVLTKVIRRLGHDITVMGSGRATVEALARAHYDLVLMDVQMPDMDGLEATRRIRAREALTGARTPIVALTASAMKGDEALCLEAGMDAYLPKPVLPDELRRLILRMLAREG
jgi:signal transduction histidine kinase/DNA-binding NarL/FixJ family response regulator